MYRCNNAQYVFYTTLRDDNGNYLGMLAVTGNIARWSCNPSDCDWLIPGTWVD